MDKGMQKCYQPFANSLRSWEIDTTLSDFISDRAAPAVDVPLFRVHLDHMDAAFLFLWQVHIRQYNFSIAPSLEAKISIKATQCSYPISEPYSKRLHGDGTEILMNHVGRIISEVVTRQVVSHFCKFSTSGSKRVPRQSTAKSRS